LPSDIYRETVDKAISDLKEIDNHINCSEQIIKSETDVYKIEKQKYLIRKNIIFKNGIIIFLTTDLKKYVLQKSMNVIYLK
jgi:hypothetical protein